MLNSGKNWKCPGLEIYAEIEVKSINRFNSIEFFVVVSDTFVPSIELNNRLIFDRLVDSNRLDFHP